MNLKKAIEKNELEKFIQEREKEKGDKKYFDSTLASMVGKSKVNPTTFYKEKDENCSDTRTP
jgi:hypothetical protein